MACQQGGSDVELTANGEMRFNVTAGTRVANDEFEVEDKVGLYVTDYVDAETPAPLQVSGNRANNEAMTFDGVKWNIERPIYWGEGKSDVYAYYPYTAEISNVDEMPFSVATDQDVEGAYEASDLLWAKAAGVSQSGGAVSLAMKHAMSRLVVKIVAGEKYVGSLPADATVHLHSTVTDALVALSTGSVVKNPYAGAKSIKMHNLGLRTFAEGKAVVYEAIVLPQMLETSVPLLEINSKSVSYLLEDAFNFKPGTSYTYTAVLNESTTAIKVEIGCEIEDWNNIGGNTGSDSEGDEDDGDGIDLSTYTDLSAEGTANCYLVQGTGDYKFLATMGSSLYHVGNVKEVLVLWETFGTDVMPNVGDLVTDVGYKNGYVYFSTPAEFKNGNASIIVYNSLPEPLWSWHIWCSEEGWNDQVYPNNVGTMMDRNLGATSATPGDVGAFGLLYQWGRKDPFLGSCTKSGTMSAASTGVWNGIRQADDWVTSIRYPNSIIGDWRGGGTTGTDYWNYSKEKKSMFDPCPVGYRVPYDDYYNYPSGYYAFWQNALGADASTSTQWDSINCGMHWTLADGKTTAWYPAAGYRIYTAPNSTLSQVGTLGNYWSAGFGDSLYFSKQQVNYAGEDTEKAFFVRCIKE